jgi:hypothetical protein
VFEPGVPVATIEVRVGEPVEVKLLDATLSSLIVDAEASLKSKWDFRFLDEAEPEM